MTAGDSFITVYIKSVNNVSKAWVSDGSTLKLHKLVYAVNTGVRYSLAMKNKQGRDF